MDASRPNASSLERVDGDCNDYVSLAKAPKDLLGAVLCGERRRSTVERKLMATAIVLCQVGQDGEALLGGPFCKSFIMVERCGTAELVNPALDWKEATMVAAASRADREREGPWKQRFPLQLITAMIFALSSPRRGHQFRVACEAVKKRSEH